MFIRTCFIVFSVLCFGCTENGLSNFEVDLSAPGPVVQVVPPAVNFGAVGEGDEAVRTVLVTNQGQGELHIQHLEIEGVSFSLVDERTSFRLPPTASVEVEVRFSPDDAVSSEGSLIVVSNDPASPGVVVPLDGEGAIPKLAINPDPFDFGLEYIGCETEQRIELRNVGKETLVIDDIVYDGASSLSVTKS